MLKTNPIPLDVFINRSEIKIITMIAEASANPQLAEPIIQIYQLL